MIRQFDVVRNPARIGRNDRPFLINIQHDHFGQTGRRIVAPLVMLRAIKPVSRLNPSFDIMDEHLYLMPNDLATFSARDLGAPVANLATHRDRIIAAFDLIITGI